jgi:hypothetical protein
VAISFGNLVKAQVTQSVLAALLERWGYRVTRLGIEELFGEVKHIDLPTYHSLDLPPQLRTLPDLLVAKRDMSEVFLVEVKFRKRFDEETARDLHQELRKQREHWPQSYAVLMVANTFVDQGRFHQDHIRVVRPNETERLVDPDRTMESRWNGLPALNGVFCHPQGPKAGTGMADSVTTVLRQLASL